MPIYNPYQEVVEPAKYVAPLDLNLLLKGTQYKQQNAEKNLSEIQGKVNNILSIPAYGKDKEILNQKIQELQQSMQGLNVSDLSTPQSSQQINSIINQFASNPDVQAAAQRGYAYNTMMSDKKEMEKKGEIYINSGLRKLNSYYSGNDYIRDVKFSNDGFAAVNMSKVMEGVKKTMTPTEVLKRDKNGTETIVKEYNPKALEENFRLSLESNPNWKKQLQENIEAKYEGVDIDAYAKQNYEDLLEIAESVRDNARFGYSTTKDPIEKQKYLDQISAAEEDIAHAQTLINNPYAGQAFKDAELTKTMESDLKNLSQAVNFSAQSESKMNRAIELQKQQSHDFAVKAQDHRNRIEEEQAKTLAIGASSIGKSLSEVLQNPSLMSEALAAGQQVKLAEYSQKENIKLENRIQFKDKLSTLGLKGLKDTDPVSFNMINEQGDSEQRSLSYGDLKKHLQSAKKEVVQSMVAGILKSKGEIIDPSEVTVEGKGITRVIKINNSYFDGIPVSDVTISMIDQNNFKAPVTGATGASSSVPPTNNTTYTNPNDTIHF